MFYYIYFKFKNYFEYLLIYNTIKYLKDKKQTNYDYILYINDNKIENHVFEDRFR